MTHSHTGAEITINGEAHPLRLTLGALAEIENLLGGDVETLQARLKKPRISDIITILHALLMGGGAQLPLTVLKASDVDLAAAAGAIAKAFEALGASADETAAPGKRQGGDPTPPPLEQA